MRTVKKRGAGEINLTPLLDVLFSILFIIMLAGTQSQQTLKSEVSDTGEQLVQAQDQIGRLEGQTAELEQQLAAQKQELDHYRNVEETGQVYEDTAVLVTMENTVKDNTHVLEIYRGREGTFYDSFTMGAGKKVYIHDHLTTMIRELVSSAEGAPVYVVFHCKNDSIYHRDEFQPISEALEALSRQEKQVFYQIMEE